MANSRIATGFDTLDALLGGEGFERHSNVLVTGKPGTGKTTLLWHLVAAFITQEKERGAVPTIQFCAFEEPTDTSLNRFLESFDASRDAAVLRDVQRIPLKQDDHAISRRKLKSNAEVIANDDEGDRVIIAFRSVFPSPKELKAKDPLEYFTAVSKLLRISRAPDVSESYLVVIDGLNSLLDWSLLQFPEYSLRQLMTCVERAFRLEQHLPTDSGTVPSLTVQPDLVIMTAEDKSDREGKWSESYMADAVVALQYDHVCPNLSHPEFVEEILTCSVLKGRNLHIQRRESCYEFDQNEGLKFFETYAARGLVALFHENLPQHAEADHFKIEDVPSFYPRLSVRLFDRAGMFHEFAVARHSSDIPRRRPMVISNADEYWISGCLAVSPTLLRRVNLESIRCYSPLSGSVIPELYEKLESLPGFVNGNSWAAVPHHLNLSFLVHRATDLVLGELPCPKTWEELEDICKQKKEIDPTSYPLLLETKTIDSFIATMLELFWSHAGGWTTEEDGEALKIQYESGHSEDGVIAALVRFRRWFEQGLVRRHSTIDPRHDKNDNDCRDWLYARHWYSTLVDTLTAVDDGGGKVCTMRPSDVRVCQIPVGEGLANAVHPSTWGEWYLAVDGGTENYPLAESVINNHLSCSKVIRRAVTGAGLPPFEEFYREYGDCNCFGTNKSFNEIRKMLNGAISRAAFARYRFVMQRLYALGQWLMTSRENSMERTKIHAAWKKTVGLIEAGPGV